MQKPAERLVEGLNAARSSETKKAAVPRRQVSGKSAPPIIYPTKFANLSEATVFDIAPLELARQLTLIDFGHYHQISDREMLMWRFVSVVFFLFFFVSARVDSMQCTCKVCCRVAGRKLFSRIAAACGPCSNTITGFVDGVYLSCCTKSATQFQWQRFWSI